MRAERLIHATITRAGDIVYDCQLCSRGRRRRQHFHGATSEREGDIAHRASHCPEAPGVDVAMLIVHDERKKAAA